MRAASVDVAVLGGGIAGLSAAWDAHKRGLSVCLLEASGRVGGKIRSEHQDGYRFEGRTAFSVQRRPFGR